VTKSDQIVTKINQSSDHNVTKTKTKKRSLHARPIALRANCWLRVLWYTVELVFIMSFLAQISFSPSLLPFSSFQKLFRRFVFHLSSWHYWPVNHITLLVFFSFYPILSLIAVLLPNLLPMYFHAKTFSSPRTSIWSETSLFFKSPVRLKNRWKYKSLLSDLDHVFSTIPNIVVHFDQLVAIMNFGNCSSLDNLVKRY